MGSFTRQTGLDMRHYPGCHPYPPATTAALTYPTQHTHLSR